MARRNKSLAFNSPEANPFESAHPVVSPFHREHRSKKGRHKSIQQFGNVVLYRKKLADLKLKELEENEKQAYN